jgi:nitroreductase
LDTPRLLGEPAPDDSALDLAVAAALRAPDHGGLRPWHVVPVAGDAWRVVGEVLAASLLRREPATPAERLDLERAKPLRAPLVIAVGAALQHDHKIPVWEQEVTAAPGTMNLLNAFDAHGFGAMWRAAVILHAAAGRAAGDAGRDRIGQVAADAGGDGHAAGRAGRAGVGTARRDRPAAPRCRGTACALGTAAGAAAAGTLRSIR